MLDSLALLTVNPSSQVITSEPVLLYNTQLSPSWRTADYFVVSFFFFSCTLKAAWISSWADATTTKDGREHTSALCLGRSLWGRSGFMERSLAQQVRGGLQWRCSEPSTRIPREKNQTTAKLHNMHMTRRNSRQKYYYKRMQYLKWLIPTDESCIFLLHPSPTSCFGLTLSRG